MIEFEFNEKNLTINTSLDEELEALIYKRKLAKKATILFEEYIDDIRQKLGVIIHDYSNIYFSSDSLNVIAHVKFSFNTTEKLTPIKVENLMNKIGMKTVKGSYPKYKWVGAKLNFDKKKYEIDEKTSDIFEIFFNISNEQLKEDVKIKSIDELFMDVIYDLDEYARNYDYEYGLPIAGHKQNNIMIDIIKNII